MTLYQKLAEVESKVGAIEVRLGLPERKHLAVRQRVFNTSTKVYDVVDTLIIPQPYITSVPPRYSNLQVSIEGADSVYLSINDLMVEIPRTYPKSLFIPEGNTSARFILEPPVSNNQIVYSNSNTKTIDGVRFYRNITLFDNDPVVWKLILTKEKDTPKVV
jgi:hypothetical protein